MDSCKNKMNIIFVSDAFVNICAYVLALLDD